MIDRVVDDQPKTVVSTNTLRVYVRAFIPASNNPVSSTDPLFIVVSNNTNTGQNKQAMYS